MDSSHYRKIDLQSSADFTYLHGNAIALSRQKLDLHLPPSANPDDGPDPMRERVRELVDDFINRTFSSASASIAINGLDSSSPEFPFPGGLTAPAETVEYEPYDAKLAARVSSLYAQLESLTTTVAQLRRDAPGKAARQYAEQLNKAIEEDDKDLDEEEEGGEDEDDGNQDKNYDADMPDTTQPQQVDAASTTAQRRRRKPRKGSSVWNLDIPLGTENEAERWANGEIAELYEDALRAILRLQGEAAAGENAETQSDGLDGNALASTVGKAERASRAVEFVEEV
ncbi:kinetochore protein Mis14 like-domain-containing protein [Aspergillus keveii]|uniref:Kinetochore protein Mis14 like-domain-containing protein n=1 Tax=Aspergillus keveii TaxID=714993 RepID=A0ABR4FYY1_9EURO